MARKGEYKINAVQFKNAAAEYLEECKEAKKVPLLSEFAFRLGIYDKAHFYRYADREYYAKAYASVQRAQEIALSRKVVDDNKPVGGIFLLKALHGYTDVQKIDLTSNGESLAFIQLPSRE